MSKQGASRAQAPGARLLGRIGLCLIVAIGLLAPLPAAARHWPAAESAPVFEWILLDAETGQVLSEHNADVPTPPASLTKMMTLYLTFEALNQGRIRLDQQFYVSEQAASRAPSKLALTPGNSVSVRDLILGIVTKSANDAASVLAEGLGGTEANFVQYMNWKARQLGMQQTWYRNASGLPDPDQRTTARDVARLALALIHQFPREYRYFSIREFDFRGEIVHGHNHLLDWYQGADGIKTGYVNASGFNLAASAVRDGRRQIGVIMGGRSWRSRDEQMASLLDQGFAVLAAARPAQPQYARQPLARRRRCRPPPRCRAAHTPAAEPVMAAAPAACQRRRFPLRRRRCPPMRRVRIRGPGSSAMLPNPRCGICRRSPRPKPRRWRARRQRAAPIGRSSSVLFALKRRRSRRRAVSLALPSARGSRPKFSRRPGMIRAGSTAPACCISPRRARRRPVPSCTARGSPARCVRPSGLKVASG